MLDHLMIFIVVGPIVVVLAFLWFCLLLVALTIGYLDPHSSPGEEWERVMDLTERLANWWRGEQR
jgi:hypothetical protein